MTAIRRPVDNLPSAMDAVDEIAGTLREGRPAVFLDFDGTLAAITPNPNQTVLSEETRDVVRRLRTTCPVAVVSGRDLDDVRKLVGVEGIAYAGSHGFNILDARGREHFRAREYQPDLQRAAKKLDGYMERIPGAFVERKGFAVAVHYRQMENPGQAAFLEGCVDRVVAGEPRLKKTGGKKIFELRPDIEWGKGHAVEYMVEILEGYGEPVVPFYIGDDLTDEEAFGVVAEKGVGVLVRGEDEERDDGGETAAAYIVAEQEQVLEFLNALAEALEE